MILARIFNSFRISDFRLLWSSDSLLTLADNMEFVVLSWYVLIQSGSPFILGAYSALRFGGTILAPFFGIVADRYHRKRLLILSRLLFVAMSGAVLALSLLGLLTVWVVLGLASILGLFRPFDRVVSLSVLPDIVNRQQIQNGVALATIGRDIMQIAGAVSGGFLLALAGTSLTYIIIVPIYFLSAMFIVGIKNISGTAPRERESVIGNLRDGLRYVRLAPVVYGLLVVAFIVNLTAFPLYFGLLAVLAREVLETTSTGLGQLLGVHAAGAMVGALIIASFSGARVPGRTVMAASALWHVGVIVVAYVRSFTLSLPVLFFTGMAQAFSMIMMTMMILTLTRVEMRGRVLGLRQLAVYGLPLGLLFSGFVAQRYGVSVALVVNGVVGLGALVLAATRWSEMMRPPAH